VGGHYKNLSARIRGVNLQKSPEEGEEQEHADGAEGEEFDGAEG
jgi:hypothetical protein